MRNSYTRQLYGGPEFLDVLSRYLSIDGLKEKYCENSKYYCFTYKMAIDNIIFDNRDDLGNDEKVDYFLVQVAMRIMSYMENSTMTIQLLELLMMRLFLKIKLLM